MYYCYPRLGAIASTCGWLPILSEGVYLIHEEEFVCRARAGQRVAHRVSERDRSDTDGGGGRRIPRD